MSTADEREIRRKLKVLRHAEQSGNTAKTCRYFGVSRSTFYRWQRRYKKFGEAGLARGEVSKPRESLNSTHAFSMAQMPLGFVPTLKESL